MWSSLAAALDAGKAATQAATSKLASAIDVGKGIVKEATADALNAAKQHLPHDLSAKGVKDVLLAPVLLAESAASSSAKKLDGASEEVVAGPSSQAAPQDAAAADPQAGGDVDAGDPDARVFKVLRALDSGMERGEQLLNSASRAISKLSAALPAEDLQHFSASATAAAQQKAAVLAHNVNLITSGAAGLVGGALASLAGSVAAATAQSRPRPEQPEAEPVDVQLQPSSAAATGEAAASGADSTREDMDFEQTLQAEVQSFAASLPASTGGDPWVSLPEQMPDELPENAKKLQSAHKSAIDSICADPAEGTPLQKFAVKQQFLKAAREIVKALGSAIQAAVQDGSSWTVQAATVKLAYESAAAHSAIMQQKYMKFVQDAAQQKREDGSASTSEIDDMMYSITTDIYLDASTLQSALKEIVSQTCNRMPRIPDQELSNCESFQGATRPG
eukprot:tig00021464_g21733.t1